MTLTLVHGQTTSPEAEREAWARVLVGYEAALRVPGVPDEARGALLRQRERCARLACRLPLSVAGGDA
jgi:hypothetical protein